MGKSNNKKNNKYNTIVVAAIAIKWGVSKHYVRLCIKGDKNSLNADKIKVDYRNLVKKIDKIILDR